MQGRPSLFVDFRLVGREGRVLPRDGRAQGELQVRGLHVAREYFRVRRVLAPTAVTEPPSHQLPERVLSPVVECMGGRYRKPSCDMLEGHSCLACRTAVIECTLSFN